MWKPSRLIVLLVLAGCSGGSDKDAQATAYSTLGVAGPTLCGFLPKADVAAMLGTDELTDLGELRGRAGTQPLTGANCTVRRAGTGEGPAVSAAVERRGGREQEYTEWLIKHPSPGMTPYPAGNPIGVANPALGTGAVATAIVGDWHIRVQRIAAALQLPTQASQTYPPYVPQS